ncbi:hypothetical protein ES703_99121 [subsurface metagenome]
MDVSSTPVECAILVNKDIGLSALNVAVGDIHRGRPRVVPKAGPDSELGAILA